MPKHDNIGANPFCIIDYPQYLSWVSQLGMSQQAQYTSNPKCWSVLIRNGNLKIGCQEHTFHKWWWFTEKEIESMHPEALYWWKKNKMNIFNLLTTMGLWSEPGAYTCYQNKEDWYDEWL